MAKTPGDSPHYVDRHVGRRVAERRISLGHSQSDLGQVVGLTFQQIQKYEKGANRISSSKLWELSRFLKVDIGYFFEGLDVDGSGGGEIDADLGVSSPTRYSIEIIRLVPRLSLRQQKLAHALIANMSGVGNQVEVR